MGIQGKTRIPALLGISSVLAGLLIFSGCARDAGTASPTTARPAAPATSAAPKPSPAGPYGHLKMAVSTFETERFDPTVSATGTMSTLMVQIYDYLIGLDAPKPAPAIAESWEMAPDGTSWTFNIRKGVKFHNGDELTAQDVKYSLDRYSSTQAFYSYLRVAIQSVEVVDNYTVRVVTKGPQPQILTNLGAESASAYALILPKDYIAKNGLPGFEQRPVGSGPFKFVSHAAADSVTYEANTGYWGQVPAFKNLSVILMPEEATRVAAIKTGMLDVIDASQDSVVDLEKAGFRRANLSLNPVGFLFYNVYDPLAANLPTGDLKVRQALSYAVNREEIIKNLFAGTAKPAYAPHLTDKSMYIDAAFWNQYIPQVFNYNVDKAKQLLKDAGYANGFTVKLFSYPAAGGPYLPKLTEVLQGYWKAIGVNGQIIPVDWGAFSGTRWIGSGKSRKANPDIVGAVSAMRNQQRADPIASISHATDSTGSWAAFGTSSGGAKPEVDQLMAKARSALSDKERGQYVDQVVKIEVDSFVWVPIALVPQLAVLGPNVDIAFPPMASVVSQYAAIAKHRTP